MVVLQILAKPAQRIVKLTKSVQDATGFKKLNHQKKIIGSICDPRNGQRQRPKDNLFSLCCALSRWMVLHNQ